MKVFLPAIAVFEFQSKENSASTMSVYANFANKSSCLNGSCALPAALANDATVAVLHKVRLCFNRKVLLLTNKSRVTFLTWTFKEMKLLNCKCETTVVHFFFFIITAPQDLLLRMSPVYTKHAFT